MIFCDLQEPQKQTIARFINGLHKEVTDAVELQPYVSFEDEACREDLKTMK